MKNGLEESVFARLGLQKLGVFAENAQTGREAIPIERVVFVITGRNISVVPSLYVKRALLTVILIRITLISFAS